MYRLCLCSIGTCYSAPFSLIYVSFLFTNVYCPNYGTLKHPGGHNLSLIDHTRTLYQIHDTDEAIVTKKKLERCLWA